MDPESSLPFSQTSQLVPILSPMNSVHTYPPYFSTSHSNIIFPSMPRSSKRSHPFTFPDHNSAKSEHTDTRVPRQYKTNINTFNENNTYTETRQS